MKSIEAHSWHPEEKCWSLPNIDGALERALRIFGDGEIYIGPTFQL